MTAQTADQPALPIRLHRDHLYIDAENYETHLAKVGSVALVRDGDDLLIFPIATASAGGFVIKQVNMRGDRAIHAADFFRLAGIDDALDISFEAKPHPAIAGFAISDLFAAAKTRP